MTIQKEVLITETYKNLKSDLKLCVKYHRRNKSELVKEYFWTDNWEEINKQLQVICKPFSLIQQIQIESLISDLHNFYSSNTQPNDNGRTKERTPTKDKGVGMEEQSQKPWDDKLAQWVNQEDGN